MRMAAHHLVRFMTAGMALITCHEPVLISINGQLKNAFLNALGVSSCTIFALNLVRLASDFVRDLLYSEFVLYSCRY